MMKKILFVSLCALLMVFAATSLKAQNSRDRWKYDDYFPDDYFSTDPTDYRKHVHVGEVVYYMRLADITPLFEEKQGEGDTLLRLNYIPKFAHPLFIQVRRHHDQIRLEWQKGTAFRGYISSSMYMEPSDTGYVDATEKQYYGNSWEKGILDSGGRELTREEWNRIRQILTDIDFVHYKHLNGCWGFRTPFLLEYADHKKTVAHYTECPDEAKEGRLAKLLVSLVDPQYEDMVVYSVNEKNGIIKPEYPGGETACKQFVESSVRYPDDALRDLVEFTAYLDVIIEKDGSVGYVRDDSWPKSPYGFADELIRVVKTMPKWKPAIRKGDTVRCYAHITHKFTQRYAPNMGIQFWNRNATKLCGIELRNAIANCCLIRATKGRRYVWDAFITGNFCWKTLLLPYSMQRIQCSIKRLCPTKMIGPLSMTGRRWSRIPATAP